MSFYRRIKYFLVHTLMLSNKAAQQLIDAGLVEIDGVAISDNCMISDHSEIRVNGIVEREKTPLVYLKFYKPREFESTLNPALESNMASFFSGYNGLAIAGRLDKMSEGLMLLSNDGKWVERICNPKFEKEKEYLVTLDREPDDDFIAEFSAGVKISRHTTLPCRCEKINTNVIKVTLKEGKNRQIRRMCRSLGYAVTQLQRTRMADIFLDDLKPGEVSIIKI